MKLTIYMLLTGVPDSVAPALMAQELGAQIQKWMSRRFKAPTAGDLFFFSEDDMALNISATLVNVPHSAAPALVAKECSAQLVPVMVRRFGAEFEAQINIKTTFSYEGSMSLERASETEHELEHEGRDA